MPYDEQKLHHFETSILTEASLKAAEIEQEISAFTSQEMEKTRQEEYKKEFGYMQSRVKNIKQNYSRLITKEGLNSKRELLEFRNRLIENIFNRVKNELENFSSSEDYQSFLINKIRESSKEFPCENATIYLREADMKYSNQIKKILPKINFESDDNNYLGGYKIINTEIGLLLDESFDNTLCKQRRGFYERCGLTV